MNQTTPSPRAPRHYLFALVDGGGTVPPELAAARRLVERGHHVTVLAEDSMADDVRASGARFRRWSSAPNRPTRLAADDPYRDWECKNPIQLFDRLLDLQFVGPAPAYAADVDAAISEQTPDLIVCSMFALGAMIAAESAAIPFDMLLPNIYLLPAPGLPPMGLGLRPAHGPLGRLRDRTITAFTERSWAKGLSGVNALRAERGLAPLDRLWDQASHARRQLVMTSAAFDFPCTLPENARYVGAVLDDPTWAQDAVSGGADREPDRPFVLVAMSSTFQDQQSSIQRIVDALAGLPVTALVTTGPALDPSTIEARPNVEVVAAASHRELLRSADVVVTHGGHGTVVKALAAGVPLVVMPHGRDQGDNAARVEAREAGVKVSRNAKPPAIARAISKVLHDATYAEHARVLGEAIVR
ncbi:MAG: glycosyltransferase, partial [Ilumatobacteraceae bacterium]